MQAFLKQRLVHYTILSFILLPVFHSSAATRRENYKRYKRVKNLIKKAVQLGNSSRPAAGFKPFRKAIRLFKQGIGRYTRYSHFHHFGRSLNKKKHYGLAVKALLMIPYSRKIPYARYLLARVYEKQKQFPRAARIFRKLLYLRGKNQRYASYAALRLTNILYKQNNGKEIFQRHKQLLHLASLQKKRSLYYTRYRITRSLQAYAFQLASQGKKYRSLRTISTAYRISRMFLGKYRKYLSRYRILMEKKALQFWYSNRHKRKRAYQHKVLVLIMPNLDAVWTDADGNRKHTVNKLSRREMSVYPLRLFHMNLLTYYLSRGRINLKFIEKTHQGKIRGIRNGVFRAKVRQRSGRPVESIGYATPNFSSGKDYPAELVYRYRNKIDTILYIYPSNGITRTSTGGISYLEIVPGQIKAKYPRGILTIASTALKKHGRLLVHEFFHAVEGAYYKSHSFPMHVFRKKFRRYWPSWYRGEGELVFYERFFRRIVLKDGARRLRFRRKKDYTSRHRFKKALKSFRRNSSYLKKITPSGNISRQAFSAYLNHQYKEAIRLYEKALNKYPGKSNWYLWYGYSLFKLSRYKEAAAALGKFLQKRTNNSKRAYALQKAAIALVKKSRNYKQAIRLIRRHWESRPHKKIWGSIAVYMGIALGELGEFKKAKRWFWKAVVRRALSRRTCQRYINRYK